MEGLIEMKVSRIVSNTIMLLDGTVYEDKEYTDKYGYKAKYRLLPLRFGIYGGEKVFEVEKVGITTNTLSFEDYLETRIFAFIIEMFFNSKIFRELEYFLEDYKLNYYDYIYFMYKNLENAPGGVKEVIKSFKKQSIHELKDTEESLNKYYSDDENFKKVDCGEEGGNLKYIHKALLLSKHHDSWINYVLIYLKKFLISKNIKIGEDFNDVSSFIKCKQDGVLDSNRTNTPVTNSFDCDIIQWINQESRTKTLREYRNGQKFKVEFTYDKSQIIERNHYFKRYKSNTQLDLSNIMLAIKPQEKLFRKYHSIEQ